MPLNGAEEFNEQFYESGTQEVSHMGAPLYDPQNTELPRHNTLESANWPSDEDRALKALVKAEDVKKWANVATLVGPRGVRPCRRANWRRCANTATQSVLLENVVSATNKSVLESCTTQEFLLSIEAEGSLLSAFQTIERTAKHCTLARA